MSSRIPDKKAINRHATMATFVLAIVMFILSMAGNSSAGDTERIAKFTRARVESRLELLEDYVAGALDPKNDEHICLSDLPEDMVIYKYVNDSLRLWSNQFSVLNDDVSNRMVFQRLTNLRNRIVSPLTEVSEEYSYMNLGPKWYIEAVKDPETSEVSLRIPVDYNLLPPAACWSVPFYMAALDPETYQAFTAPEVAGELYFPVEYDEETML